MNKTKEQMRLMIENAVGTARDEHGLTLTLSDLDKVAEHLLHERCEDYLQSVFGSCTLRDILLMIELIEESKLENARKEQALAKKAQAKAQKKPDPKIDAH